MSRRLRLGAAAAADVVVALAVGCSNSPSGPSNSSAPASSSGSPPAQGTLTVFGAGTLSTPFAAEIKAFTKANPGVTVHSQAVMQANGFTSITPALASSQGKVPASLQSLTTQWPGG